MAMLKFLNGDALKRLDPDRFKHCKPYPWANPADLVTPEGYRSLRENLPELSRFKKMFGKQRKHGQQSHDRYSLKYSDGLDVPRPWQEFIGELRGEQYAEFIRANFGVRDFNLSFFWFFTPAGCSVSPHCDHYRKIGVHLFYLNSEDDWKEDWGGETLILGSDKKIRRASAPAFSDFSTSIAGKTTGTHSLLLKRTSQSWHGVREITCPDGYMRKVFMVSFQHSSIYANLYHMLAA